MTVININGKEIDFEASINFMDDEIREKLHSEIAPCSEQEFFTSYEKAHQKKFKEEWFLSGENPCW